MKKIFYAFFALTIGLLTSCGNDDDPVTIIDDSPTEKTAILDVTQNTEQIKGIVDAYNSLPDNMKALGLAIMMNEIDGLKLNLNNFSIECETNSPMDGDGPYLRLYMPNEFVAEGMVSSTNSKVKVKSVELVHHHKIAQDETHYFIYAFNKTYKHLISNDALASSFADNECELTPVPTYDSEKKSDLFDLTSSNGKFSIKPKGKSYGYIELVKIIVKYEILP